LKPPALAHLQVAERIAWDFEAQALTTGPHPIALHRPDLERLGASTIHDLRHQTNGSRALVAGAVISRQRRPRLPIFRPSSTPMLGKMRFDLGSWPWVMALGEWSRPFLHSYLALLHFACAILTWNQCLLG